MTCPGTVVRCEALDCRPAMLVLVCEGDQLRAALVADLASETIQRLRYGHTDTVVQAVDEADGIDSHRVPSDDVAPAPAFGGER
ncbi:hypothetical protein EGH22_18465 [Halomicroarcula sp. F28]|uniref:hypothetical protein n=1 Tax=Haloarcula salinisoli TaxID=2487746 RepID=UPI001C72D38F|nr:hypothetical protein [Halomicroarcula salinisoli]MBX0288317.1 hypothetical protein [Halomicroarcula salinisoli]